VLGAALFIRYGTAKYLSPYWFASRSFAIRLGDWSYAIYLWHWPLIVIATYVLDQYRWPHKFAIIAITVLFASASQKLIEDPLRQAKYFKLPRRAFFAMGTSLVLSQQPHYPSHACMLPNILMTWQCPIAPGRRLYCKTVPTKDSKENHFRPLPR